MPGRCDSGGYKWEGARDCGLLAQDNELDQTTIERRKGCASMRKEEQK